MPAPFRVLALDLHNTVYDEVMEYGLAIDEAVSHWLEVADKLGTRLERETLYKELATRHRALGSDWDDDVWRGLPSLVSLGLKEAEFRATLLAAEKRRREKSRALTLAGLYEGAGETLAALKNRGVRVYLVTEAAADAAMQALGWLALADMIDGLYSYASRKAVALPPGIHHTPFPPDAKGGHLKKPHPFVLAGVILDETIRRGLAPKDIKISDVFELTQTEDFFIPDLPMPHDVNARLALRPTPYAEALARTQSELLYVGDSKFKDGLLARNAGCAFGYAAYGKKVRDMERERHSKSLAIMYAVTGWDDSVMKLTQDASASNAVNAITPDFVFETSLAEALPLFTP